jgi:hypothetical protein
LRDNKVVRTKKKNEISKFIFTNDIFSMFLANYTFSFMSNEKKRRIYADKISRLD